MVEGFETRARKLSDGTVEVRRQGEEELVGIVQECRAYTDPDTGQTKWHYDAYVRGAEGLTPRVLVGTELSVQDALLVVARECDAMRWQGGEATPM